MAAAPSIADADLMVIDDLYFIAMCHGRNEADASGLLAISDEEYAVELQLQEVMVSSAIAANAAESSLTLQLDSAVHEPNDDAAASETSALAIVAECSSSSAPPSHVAPAAGDSGDIAAAAAATQLLAVAECSSSSAGASIPATFLFCKICMDYVSPSDVHRPSRGCAHALCTTCLVSYIGAKIKDRIADVKCPEEDCGSVVDPELCQVILPREAFEAWGAALCISMVLGDSNVCYCPFNDCSEMLVDDRGGDVPESECPACRRLFCARCGVPWHAGVSCTEYGQLAPGDKGKEDLVVLEMAKGKKWRRCPRCKFLVDKYDGCVHITCRCGFQFCYGCGVQWGQPHHSSCHSA